MMKLDTPHIPLRLSLEHGLAILHSLGCEVREEKGPERYFQVETESFRVAIYPSDHKVGSVWYDDPLGRDSEAGKAETWCAQRASGLQVR